MASEVDVANMALSHFGSETVITSISPPDGSVEAGHAKRFFAHARKEALEQCVFTWAKKRVVLAEVTNPSSIWTYAYALPSDCLGPLRVLQQASVQDWLGAPWSTAVTPDDLQLFTERGSADFEVEGSVLLTHEPDAVLLYTRDITDLTRWTATAVTALSYLLASYMAGPLVKGEAGAKAGQQFRGAAMRILTQAGVQDANGSSERNDFIPVHIRDR